MKHASPLESPKNIFQPNQAPRSLQVPKIDPNIVRNLGVNFEELMPALSDPASPNFQKMNDFLKGPGFVLGSKPISMVLPELSQNSCFIPLPDNCLETSIPFEDLVGQLESPKLSDKMQMIFNSNVNLSESIMKNTFRAVDESRVRLEDKDLQVELEIRELKLHHLQKKLEGCLASSKNTLALNAQLSQNVSKMVSPAKSTGGLSSNIKPRTSSRVYSPNGRNAEGPPSPVPFQLTSSKSDASSTSKPRPKSVNHIAENRLEEINIKSFPITRDSFRNNNGMGSEVENPAFKREGRVIEREISCIEENLRSASMQHQESNSRFKDNVLSEAYQKLSSYYDPRETEKVGSNQQAPQAEVVGELVKHKTSHHKSSESIASNNITFYTNLPEKDTTQVETEDQTKNFTRLQSNDCLSEDQDQTQRRCFLFHSKSREAISAPITVSDLKLGNMAREISLTDADGKERIFTIKPKEILSFQRLEAISITPLENKLVPGLGQQRVRSQLSSFQLSETEELSQLNEHLRQAQDQYGFSISQTGLGAHSKKTSFYDNSNIASMNLDKPDQKLSGFAVKALQESQLECETVGGQKDLYVENLKLQILNHPKCQKYLTGEDSKSQRTNSTGYNNLEANLKENDGLECYFKQKIQDFREFLNEFEKILPAEKSLSPIKEAPKKRKKVKTMQDGDFQGTNNPYNTAEKERDVENVDSEPKIVDDTPRVPVNENKQFMKAKYNTSTKKGFAGIGYLTEQSPSNNNIKVKNHQSLQIDNDHEFVSRQLFKENQDSPFSAQPNFLVGKPTFNNEPVKKKTKSTKNGSQKESSSKTLKGTKSNRSVALPLDPNSEQLKRKTHDKSSSLKASVAIKKSKDSGIGESKKSKDKTLLRGNSKSNVEVINLAKPQQRTNSVFIVSQAQ